MLVLCYLRGGIGFTSPFIPAGKHLQPNSYLGRTHGWWADPRSGRVLHVRLKHQDCAAAGST
jgi:hypothetical protein